MSAVEKVLELADQYYARGYEGLGHLPHGSRAAIRLAGVVYQEIGNEIRRQDFRVMSGRVFVPLRRKLSLLGNCLIAEMSFRVSRMSSPFAFNHSSPTTQFLPSQRINQMNYETRYLGYLGLSLTFIMATTLFFLMGINPKQTVYEGLPWIYAIGCAVIATVTGIMARRMNHFHELETAETKHGQ